MKKYLFAAIAAILVFPITSNAQATPNVVSFTATESSTFGGSTKIEWRTTNTNGIHLSYIGGLTIWNAQTNELLPTVQLFTTGNGTLYIKTKNMVGRTASSTFTLDASSTNQTTYEVNSVRKTLTIGLGADASTPAVKLVSPSSGAAGTAITITGVNFETSAANQWITFAVPGEDAIGEKSFKIVAKNSTTIETTFPTTLSFYSENTNALTAMPVIPGRYAIIIENNNGRGEVGYFTVTETSAAGTTSPGSGLITTSSSTTATTTNTTPSIQPSTQVPTQTATQIETTIPSVSNESKIRSETKVSGVAETTTVASVQTPVQPEKRSAVANFFIKIFKWFKK